MEFEPMRLNEIKHYLGAITDTMLSSNGKPAAFPIARRGRAVYSPEHTK